MVRRAVLTCAVLASLWPAMPARASSGADIHIGALAVPHANVAPPIDGTLDSPSWKNAAVAHLTYDLRDHALATQDTTVYTMSDDAYLYVAVDAKQNIPVRATE